MRKRVIWRWSAAPEALWPSDRSALPIGSRCVLLGPERIQLLRRNRNGWWSREISRASANTPLDIRKEDWTGARFRNADWFLDPQWGSMVVWTWLPSQVEREV